jgi:Tol biopolymer transport system component
MNTVRVSLALALAGPIALASSLGAQARRPMTFDDFAAMKAVSDPQLSPDGQTVLYAVRTTDVDANRRSTTTYTMALGGGSARAFPDDTTRAAEARWSPDGRRVAYTAGGQLWIANADGSGRKKLTSLNGQASGPVWSPAGDEIAFVSAVWPDCTTDSCNVQKDKAREDNKVKAHVADNLMFRHWNAWDEGTRSHLFVVSVDGGSPRDLTPGAKYDVPPGPFGGSEGYAFAPDGKEITYTAKDQGRADAWTTDVNLYVVPVSGGTATVITKSNLGADQNPVYSPDGKYIAYGSQKRGGFESDRMRLMLYDRAKKTSAEVLPAWDRNADGYWFAPDGKSIYVATTDKGRDKLFRATLGATGVSPGLPALVVGESNNVGFSFSRDAKAVVWMRDATNRPPEVFAASLARARASEAANTSGGRFVASRIHTTAFASRENENPTLFDSPTTSAGSPGDTPVAPNVARNSLSRPLSVVAT